MTHPRSAARQIVDALAAGALRVRMGKDAPLLDRLSRLMPTRAIRVITKKIAAAASTAGS